MNLFPVLAPGASLVNSTATLESARSMDSCFKTAAPTFLYPPHSNLPTSTEELDRTCKEQARSLKCLKDKSRVAPYLIKRGVGSFVTSRQRHSKKYCANVNSELSRKYVKDLKCVMDKRVDVYRKTDIKFANTFKAMMEQRGQFKDTATELKLLCCAMIGYKKKMIENVGSECESSRATMEELYSTIVTSDMDLVCEDEDKLLTKVCPNLPPLANVSTMFVESPGNGPSTLGIYLFATLGDSAQN